jgi:hypothetical protein
MDFLYIEILVTLLFDNQRSDRVHSYYIAHSSENVIAEM